MKCCQSSTAGPTFCTPPKYSLQLKTYLYHPLLPYLVKEDKHEIVADTKIVRTDVDEFEPFDVTT